ncbi:hypothetical protein ABVT39_002100 [Epinephelus coioides]
MAASLRYLSQILADQRRSKTRINISSAFDHYLKAEKGLKSHAGVPQNTGKKRISDKLNLRILVYCHSSRRLQQGLLLWQFS